METASTFSATRPMPPPPSPPHRYGDDRPNFEPIQEEEPQMMPQYMYYPPPPEQLQSTTEPSLIETLSKKVLFLIFLAFIIGLFVGKSMVSTVVIQPK
jgi:hypothetical protein